MKKIISFVLVVALMLGATLSLSSCFSAVETIVSGITGANGGSNDSAGDDGGSQNNGGNMSSDNSQNDAGNSASGSSSYLPERDENAAAADALTSQSRSLLSTVSIVASFEVRRNGYYGGGATTTETSFGSGVFYSVDRAAGNAYIITNFHVVYSSNSVNGGIADEIIVYLYGQEYEEYAITATYVGGSLNYDIAVLKIEGSPVIKKSCAVAAKIGDSDDVNVLDEVIAVGNPEGYGIAVTDGIISVQSESLEMTGADGATQVTFRVMRVSAAINSGNSGGGLYNESGKLIGIVNAKRQGANIDNIGYAIPINLAINVVENILDNCDGYLNTSVYKPLLGINISSQSVGVEIEGENVVIKSVIEVKSVSSGALADGVILEGDIINSISIDGNLKTVTRSYHVTDAMLSARIGSTVVLNVTRGALTLDVSVVITESAISIIK